MPTQLPYLKGTSQFLTTEGGGGGGVQGGGGLSFFLVSSKVEWKCNSSFPASLVEKVQQRQQNAQMLVYLLS